jgi:hypothetical protein
MDNMKKYICFILFLFIQSNCFGFSNCSGFSDRTGISFNFQQGPGVILFSGNTSDNTSDGNKKDGIKIDNPFKDTNWDWFSEKYRAEKIILSVGIVSMVIGTPLFLVGIFEYFLPQSDKSKIGDATCFSLIGVGAGIITVGVTLTIVGAVRLNYLKTRDRMEVSLSIDL